MKEKRDIVENWLPRYTGTPLVEFGEYVLLTNFDNYVEWFAALHGGLVKGVDRPMPNVTADGITLINFGMGSPNAATVMDLLSAIAPKAVLFLGDDDPRSRSRLLDRYCVHDQSSCLGTR
jgi:AMP nucleosidase